VVHWNAQHFAIIKYPRKPDVPAKDHIIYTQTFSLTYL
jgi:hypothetical protein